MRRPQPLRPTPSCKDRAVSRQRAPECCQSAMGCSMRCGLLRLPCILSFLFTNGFFFSHLKSYSSLHRLGKSHYFISFHLFQKSVLLLPPLDVSSMKLGRVYFHKCHLSSLIPTCSWYLRGWLHTAFELFILLPSGKASPGVQDDTYRLPTRFLWTRLVTLQGSHGPSKRGPRPAAPCLTCFL